MRTAFAVVAVSLSLGGALAVAPAGYVYTPAGLQRAECVHNVPHGAAIVPGEVGAGGGARVPL